VAITGKTFASTDAGSLERKDNMNNQQIKGVIDDNYDDSEDTLSSIASGFHSRIGIAIPAHALLSMANWHSSGDWQFKQPVAMALPTVILKAGWLRCWAALCMANS
jgi:hypothetical protein